MKQYNPFYRHINKEVKRKLIMRNMSIPAVKAEYMKYLKDKPKEELKSEMLKIQYRAIYSDDSSFNMIGLMLGLVPCLASITALVIEKNQVSMEQSLYFVKLFTFVYMIVFTMAVLSNIIKSVSSRRNHDRNRFEQFKRECIEEILRSKRTRVIVRESTCKNG